MKLTEITPAFDSHRDASVDPVLWEIRRERRVEFMGEGRRLDDLRRWAKGSYVDKQPLGVYVADAAANKVKVTGGHSDNEATPSTSINRQVGNNTTIYILCR